MDESPKRGLLAAYGRLLGPLVRILIRNGVTFREFAEVAKQTYVDVAAKDFSVTNKEITQTRISALTGLMQGEVQRIWILSEQERKNKKASNLNRIVAVLTGWHTDSEYTGPYGVPLEVRLADKSGFDFSELVDRHTDKAVSASALIDEMVRAGLVKETERGCYKVLSRYYIPEGSAPAGLDHLSRTLGDLVTTLDHNLLEQNPKKKMFERHVYTEEGISPQDLPKFEAFAKERAMLLLEEIDNWVSQLDKPDSGSPERLSTGLGVFHYIRKGEMSE